MPLTYDHHRRKAVPGEPAPFGRLRLLGRRIAVVAAAAGFLVSGLTCGGSEPTAVQKLPVLTRFRFLEDSVGFATGESLYPAFQATRQDGLTTTAADMQWASRNSAVVSMVEAGKLLAGKPGQTWVVVSSGYLQDSLRAIVRGRLDLVLSTHLDTLTSIGDSLVLSASFPKMPGAQVPMTWGSRDSTVVRVTQAGVAIAVSEGHAYVLGLEDGGGRDSALIVVRQKLVRLERTPRVDTLPLLRAVQLAAAPVDARGHPIARLLGSLQWKSRDTSLAVVDGTGKVNARGVGTDTIVVFLSDSSASVLVTVTPLPPLRFDQDTIFTGIGQYPSYYGHQRPVVLAEGNDPQESFSISLSLSDSSIGAVRYAGFPATVGSDSSTLIMPVGHRSGVAVLTASSPRYAPATAVLRVTKPKVVLSHASVEATYNPLAPNDTVSVPVELEDSLGHQTQVGAPLTIHYRSSDTTVVVPSSLTVVVDSGVPAISVRMRPVGPGRAWLVMEPDGYTPDSTPVHVTAYQPRLKFLRHTVSAQVPWSPMYLGVGQTSWEDEVDLAQPYVNGAPVPVTFTHSSRGVIGIADSASYANGLPTFHVYVNGLGLGTDTIIASAAGFESDSMVVVVTPATFRFWNPSPDSVASLNTTVFGGITLRAVYTDTAFFEPHSPTSSAFVALLTSTDTNVLRVGYDSVTFLDPNATSRARVTPVGPGSASLVLTDPSGRARPTTSVPVTVRPAAIHLRYGGHSNMPPDVTVGLHQELPDSEAIYVDSPAPVNAPTVFLRSTDSTIVQPWVPSLHGLPGGTGDGAFSVFGEDRTGTAWIVAYGPGLIPDSIQVTVGQPQFQIYRTQDQPASDVYIAVRTVDQAGRPRNSLDPVTVNLWSTDAAVLAVDSATLVVPADRGTTPETQLHFVGPGTAAIRVSDSRNVPYAYLPGATRLIQVDSQGQPVTEVFSNSVGR